MNSENGRPVQSSQSREGDNAAPPLADRKPEERTHFGDTVVDHYRWLENRDDPAVVEHLRSENAYTESVLAQTEDLQNTIYAEIKARVQETDMSVPVAKGPWIYYSKTIEGLDYGVHCRRPRPSEERLDLVSTAQVLRSSASETNLVDEQVLLDENVESQGGPFFDIGLFDVSPNHELLLWGSDRSGDEQFRAVVRDLATGVDHDDGLEGLSHGSVWALDNKTFFYLRPDKANRPCEVWRHRVGTPATSDVLVFSEPDERFFVGIGREKDDSYIQIAVGSKISDEVWIIPADDPTVEPTLIAERQDGLEYSVSHHGDQFIINTNYGAENFRVVVAPEDAPQLENWTELFSSSDDVMIAGVDVCAKFLVLFERVRARTRIRLRWWSDGSFLEVEQPEEISTVWPGANPEYESEFLRYGYSSMITPPSVFLFDAANHQRELLKQQVVKGTYNSSDYVTERLWATSDDGTEVPLSLVRRSDRPATEPGPCVLYGYGAYEVSVDPEFSIARLSLLDRGFAFVVVHPRGGGEMGRQWYRDGKLENKQNTFSDVAAAARQLIEFGITDPSQLILRGGSAGGLLVGAVLNQVPELFAAGLAHVPFVDTLTTMLDPTLPLTVTEWEEWGNPVDHETAYRSIRAYSPMDNVSGEKSYPSVLATAGLNDTRVSYWEAAKWVQKLRHETKSRGPILLWTDLESGHGGPSGRYAGWKEEARNLAYIAWIVGCTT